MIGRPLEIKPKKLRTKKDIKRLKLYMIDTFKKEYGFPIGKLIAKGVLKWEPKFK
jgi:hypothetical protein